MTPADLNRRLAAVEALLLATTPAGYVTGAEVERLRAAVLEGAQAALAGGPLPRDPEGAGAAPGASWEAGDQVADTDGLAACRDGMRVRGSAAL